MPIETTSLAAQLRDSPLPPDATIALILGDQSRAYQVAREIERIQRGEIPPLTMEIDQVSAFVLISYLRLSLEQIGEAAPPSAIVEKVAAGLERMIALDCPEMEAVMAQARRERQGGQS